MDVSANSSGPFRAGSVVLISLRDPREKFWGALRELSVAGVSVFGLDLNSLDDFAAQVRAGDLVGPSEVFFPMHRVERIDMDAPYGILPSFSQQVEQRTGKSAAEILGAGSVAA